MADPVGQLLSGDFPGSPLNLIGGAGRAHYERIEDEDPEREQDVRELVASQLATGGRWTNPKRTTKS
jgi:hypothetical protein